MIFEYLIQENKEAFVKRVSEISNMLGISPDWLMLCMYIESRLDHKAKNKLSGATGLIQFMESTAAALGTSIVNLLEMSNVEQLDYVYKYLKVYQSKMKSFVDVYFAIFFPRAIGKSPDYVLKTDRISASKIAEQNSGYDINKDLNITVGEVRSKILAMVPADYADALINNNSNTDLA